jgi:sensor histidine kinase YesM
MKDRWLRIIAIPVIGLLFPLLLYPVGDYRLPYVMMVTLATTALIWELDRFILLQLRRRLSWEKSPLFRIIAQLIVTESLGILIVYFSFYFSYRFLYHSEIESFPLNKSISFTIVVILLLNAVYEALHFADLWKMSVSRAEVLKRAGLNTQFETLKNQVNPHFLFNSLNTLTTLIEEDEALAVRFVHELSNVYKYVLDSMDQKLVPLELELKFAEAYIFLLKMRFGENLRVKVEFTQEDKKAGIPPLTLQILIENAVKHNIVGRDKPLHLSIYRAEDDIIVCNNLQRKTTRPDSTKVGLRNIRERYRFLANRSIRIEENENTFEVRLPLIYG